MVVGDMLVLNTMRYADEIVSQEDLSVPPADLEASRVSAREVDMALRLVDDMTEAWQPDRFHDVYREDLLARIESKIQAGQTHMLTEPQAQDTKPSSSAKVIDLMSMLRQSIESRAPKKNGSGASRHRSEDDADTSAASKTSSQARKSRPAARTAGKSATAA